MCLSEKEISYEPLRVEGLAAEGRQAARVAPPSNRGVGELGTASSADGSSGSRSGRPAGQHQYRPLAWQFEAAALASSGYFVDSGQSLGSFSSFGVAVGDVDADGDLDLFVASYGADEVWLNQSRPEVVGRHLFYNHSAFDQNNANPNAFDDDAIATDKQALLPGQTASFANYTSYSRGINGVMIDIAGLPVTTLTTTDFELKVGNDNNPAGWAAAPSPASITVRPGAGVNNSDRVTLIWADNDWTTPNPEPGAIARQWLQVTVLANANTGLAANDVFYFGNAVGEAGNDPNQAFVTSIDEILARTNPHGPFNPADIDDDYDYNRDRLVTAVDQIVARRNPTGPANSLRLINVPVKKRETSDLTDSAWLCDVTEMFVSDRPSNKVPGRVAVDAVFATYWS